MPLTVLFSVANHYSSNLIRVVQDKLHPRGQVVRFGLTTRFMGDTVVLIPVHGKASVSLSRDRALCYAVVILGYVHRRICGKKTVKGCHHGKQDTASRTLVWYPAIRWLRWAPLN